MVTTFRVRNTLLEKSEGFGQQEKSFRGTLKNFNILNIVQKYRQVFLITIRLFVFSKCNISRKYYIWQLLSHLE